VIQLTEDFTLIPRDLSMPSNADFSIVIDSSALEPEVHCGQTVYVSCKTQLTEQDIGVFLYNDNIYCRRWCEDYSGALVLLGDDKSLIYLDKQQRRRCLCLGKVLI
jgi:hypothetical protein